ncbi:MAG: ABC transporter ATP-binding protein [Candidatus Methanomethylophilaceae archaeon]|jgi:iron complex transport system ATP-binding protein|nr:ABC transporter ATP-binding protein [Candidatus Methanomethylophilaceae archaeon]
MDDTEKIEGKGRAVIEIKDLEFGYNPSNPVLKDISHIFDTPEFVCIMGPNGVGKSTLIHCINKILKPTKGVVLIDGRDTREMKLKEVANEIGYVPASSEDSFPLTVVDTVMVGMQNDYRFGVRKEDLEQVYDILKLLSIDHLAMRDFNELSAGQHQKVMLARGLVRSPPVVLLDEPTSNLDIRHQIEVTKILSEMPRKKNSIVIMISHDINITAKYADKILMIANGGIYAYGTPKEVLTKESIRDVYGVDADIIDVNGRPHVILNDSIPMDD